ncbi:MAG: PilN domain-containing protein [Thermodesulfobacteriota bacterium]
MIRINLLPIKEIKRKIRLRNEVAFFAAALLGILIVLASLSLGMAQKVSALTAEITSLENKRKSVERIVKQIDKLQKDKKALETKLQAIDKLKSESQLMVHVLDEVANRTPTASMWLTSLKVSGTSLQLSGVALDNATIAQYMRALESSEYFGPPELANASQTVVAGQKLKSFSLAMAITPLQTVPPADSTASAAKEGAKPR